VLRKFNFLAILCDVLRLKLLRAINSAFGFSQVSNVKLLGFVENYFVEELIC
jgi:hypothetical protein